MSCVSRNLATFYNLRANSANPDIGLGVYSERLAVIWNKS